MIPRLWVRIPAPNTVRTFFTFICYKNCHFCWKKTKINEKEAGVGPSFCRGGSVLTLYSDDLSSNSAQACSFFLYNLC